MDNNYFLSIADEMKTEDIDNNFFRAVAEKYGVITAAGMLLLFDEIYPNAKEGQRKISVPLKSTFIFRANKRKIDGLVT